MSEWMKWAISLLVLSVSTLMSPLLCAWDGSAIVRIQPLLQQNKKEAFFVDGIYVEEQTRQDFVVNAHGAGLTFEWTGLQTLQNNGSASQEDSTGQAGSATQYEGVLNEAYWETTIGELDLTLGKKRISWGVGYAFRPLDILLHSPRLTIVTPIEEGLPMLAVERYTESGAWTLLCGKPVGYHKDSFYSGKLTCAGRAYALMGDVELQGLVYSNDETDLGIGAGFSLVSGESLEIHGSVLYQSHYTQSHYTQRFSSLAGGEGFVVEDLIADGDLITGDDLVAAGVMTRGNPIQTIEKENGAKILLGFNMTWASGLTGLFEIWHDESGYTRNEWKALRQLTQAQHAARQLNIPQTDRTTINNNIAASNQFFAQRSLLEDNLVMSLSYDGEKTSPRIDVQVSLLDKGTVLRLGAVTELSDRHRVSYGVRIFGGDKNSAYRAMPIDKQAYASWEGTFTF